MKKIIFAIMLYSLNVYSSNINLKITSQIKNGSSIKNSESSVVVALGKEFVIPFQDSANTKLKIKVTESHPFPEPDSPSELLFDMKILEIKNGKEVTLSSPKVTTIFNTNASVSMDDPKKNQSVNIIILPSKILE
jgi:hypothetical protein